MNPSPLNRDILFTAAQNALRRPVGSTTGFGALAASIFQALEEQGSIPKGTNWKDHLANEAYEFHSLGVLLADVVNELLTKGYIVPKPEGSRLDWEKFLITARGREWATANNPIPEDMTGYFRVLNDLVPGIDPVIKQYVEEALTAFNRRAFFASAVMIGAASEKAVYLLLRAVQSAIQDIV